MPSRIVSTPHPPPVLSVSAETFPVVHFIATLHQLLPQNSMRRLTFLLHSAHLSEQGPFNPLTAQRALHRILLFCVYRIIHANTQQHSSTMPSVVPQNPKTLISNVLRIFIPNIPAIIAPMAAAKLPMDSMSSRRFTSYLLALRLTPMDSSKSRAPSSSRSASLWVALARCR